MVSDLCGLVVHLQATARHPLKSTPVDGTIVVLATIPGFCYDDGSYFFLKEFKNEWITASPAHAPLNCSGNI